jgi:hypothetical protein
VTGIQYPFQPLAAKGASLVEKETQAYGVLYEDKKAVDAFKIKSEKTKKVFLEVCTEKGKSSLFRKRPDGLTFQHSAKFSIFFF